MRGVIAALALALAAALPAAAAPRSLQHVTLIGDSVADAIPVYPAAVEILGQGVDLDVEVSACRRVDDQSCPHDDGTRPPNVVQLAQEMGAALGPNVVVAVGYNDYAGHYAQNIENALAAFKTAGVKRVWWLTLRAVHHPYLDMNDEIKAAAANHPELRVIDWNVYARSHPDWFQKDGLHLLGSGAAAMSTLIHNSLLADGIAAPPPQVATRALPVAHLGHAYAARLTARRGSTPYRWSLLARAPKGIHLEADGRIVGRPRVRPGSYALNVRVKDAVGSFAVRRLVLRVAS